MESFTPFGGFLGGTIIGAAAVLLLAANGRIAGVSGILGGVISPMRGDVVWRVLFIVGLWLGAILYSSAAGERLAVDIQSVWPAMAVGGLLVGLGTRIGAGCTSGHGVCGIARQSKRSIVATFVFMGTAFVTVFLTRHVFS